LFWGAGEDFFNTVSVMEVYVDDCAFEILVVADEVGGTDDDVVEITISAAEIGCGVMSWWADKRECCGCFASRFRY
jgi:hypothetical protein